MIRLLTICGLVAYTSCQGFHGQQFDGQGFGGQQFDGQGFAGQGLGELPPDIQQVLNREIPGNGNGEFIALGGAGIGERHSNGLRNGWDGNPATRGMPRGMQGGFQLDSMFGDFGHGGIMPGGQIIQDGFQQNQFDVPPMPMGQANIGVPFVDSMVPQFDTLPFGPLLTPGQENFVPISTVMGGGVVSSLGGYGRTRHPKKPTIPKKKQTVLPKKPIITPKMPISYGKKPIFNAKNPVVFPSKPLKPIINSKRPIYPKRPVIHPKKPIIQPKKPIIHHKRPMIQPVKPVISHKISPSYPKMSINYPKKSIMHHKKSPIYPKKPTMKPFGLGGYGRRRLRGGY